MGLFDFLRKGSGEISHHTAEEGSMSVQEAEIISREFGNFLGEKMPVIKDARLLPYPKERIAEALKISIRRLSNQTDLDAGKLVNALKSCRQGLSLFSEIEPQDWKAVDYFNGFPSAKVIPEQRKKEFVDLIGKYMKRGIETG